MRGKNCAKLLLLSFFCIQVCGCYAVRWTGRVLTATGDAMVNATDHAQQERKQERAENRAEREAVLAEKERKLRLKQAEEMGSQPESTQN